MRIPPRSRLIVLSAAVVVAAACSGSVSVPSLKPVKTRVAAFPGEQNVSPVVLALRDSVCDPNDAQLAQSRGLDANAVEFARQNGYYSWCIPEYDDDQRLSDGNNGNGNNGKDYGPVAHVLAAPWLDTLHLSSLRFAQVALVEVDPDTTNNPRPNTYHELRLDGQFNCLYLKYGQPSDGSPTYDAAIDAVAPGGPNLTCPSTPSGAASQLVVLVDDQQITGDTLFIPPTTRFVEGQGKHTLIGVKCEKHWCMVGGPNAASPVPASAHASVTALTANVQGRVKGYFDDQVLGLPDNNGKYKIHRQYRASAIPAPTLQSLHVAQFVVDSGTQTYQSVGTVYFDTIPDAQSKYATLFGFTQGQNAIGLRAEIHHDGPSPKLFWYAQVTNANGQKSDIPTQRMDHSTYLKKLFGDNVTITATMRWRWFDLDEDLWVECDLGCCLVGKGS